MYFVWISEQTAIISQYSTNWLVFIAETESVYCAVRTEALNIFHVNRIIYSESTFLSNDPRFRNIL